MVKCRPVVLLLAIATIALGKRDGKIFSIFTIVNFPNDVCTGISGDTGTCFTVTECTSKTGTADGNCASGFGVCCVFSTSTCGSTITQNTSYITNPGYPSAYTTAGTCSFTVTPLSSNICQLRLDFANFATAVTGTTGVCADSFEFTVTTKRNYPNICGTNSGEHIYLETGQSTSSQTLKFTVASSTTFKILVHQIPCNVNYKAPNDCFQYMTGNNGRARSLNFEGQVMTTNQEYSVCVRQEQGFCGITWSETQGLPSTKDSFDLGGIAIAAASGGATASAEESYLTIPGAGHFSGGFFAPYNAIQQKHSGQASTNQTPFVLNVQSRTATMDGAGFDLTYRQVPCNNL